MPCVAEQGKGEKGKETIYAYLANLAGYSKKSWNNKLLLINSEIDNLIKNFKSPFLLISVFLYTKNVQSKLKILNMLINSIKVIINIINNITSSFNIRFLLKIIKVMTLIV